MIQGKKGEVEAQKVTMGLLILVVIVLVLAFFSARVFDWTTSKGDVESCRLSVVVAGNIRSATEASGIGVLDAPMVDLECPRKNIVFFPDYYTIDDNKNDYNDENYETGVKEILAKEMTECWYKMGEGEIFPFTQAYWIPNERKTNMCMVCAMIEFETTTSEKYTGLLSYLEKTSFFHTGETNTYYDYLAKEQKSVEYQVITAPVNSLALPSDFTIDSSQTYTIYFKAHGFLGVDKEYSPDWYQIGIIDTDNLKDTCPTVYN